MSKAWTAICASMYGAAAPAFALLCLAGLSGAPNMLSVLIYLGLTTAVWSLSGGLLTVRTYHNQNQVVAGILGATAMIAGLLSGRLMLNNDYAKLAANMSDMQWTIVRFCIQVSTGVLAQLLMLILLIVIRWLARQLGRGNSSLQR